MFDPENHTSSNTYLMHSTILPSRSFIPGVTTHQPPFPRWASRHLSMRATMQQMTHSRVRLYGAGAIGTVTGPPGSTQVVFAEARGSGCHTSCIHTLLNHPDHQYSVVSVNGTGKGERTGIQPLGLTNESVVRKAPLTDECEACMWRLRILS